jgi:energy-coupling factor transporter transmembrane protein EcfT
VEGLETGLTISLRTILILTGIFVTLMSMEPLALAHWLTRMRLPVGIPVAILLSLQLVEDLPDTIRRIRAAQRSRGLRVEGSLAMRLRALRFLITPVVMRSLEGALERATALQLRGLLEPLPLDQRSPAFASLGILLAVIAVLLIAYRILEWTGYLPPIG